jgi:hypothetical protein
MIQPYDIGGGLDTNVTGVFSSRLGLAMDHVELPSGVESVERKPSIIQSPCIPSRFLHTAGAQLHPTYW